MTGVREYRNRRVWTTIPPVSITWNRARYTAPGCECGRG
jgi:hypothetical protein